MQDYITICIYVYIHIHIHVFEYNAEVIQISSRLATLSAEQTSRYFGHADFCHRAGQLAIGPCPVLPFFRHVQWRNPNGHVKKCEHFIFMRLYVLADRSRVEQLLVEYRET